MADVARRQSRAVDLLAVPDDDIHAYHSSYDSKQEAETSSPSALTVNVL
jgi:hypothetical protein